MNTGLSENDPIFVAPQEIQDPVLREHWIREYPPSLCPEGATAQDNLLLSPFDCRARNFFQSVVESATEFVYISTESFTDTKFADFLKKLALTGLQLRVITGISSMDFRDRIHKVYRELLAHGIELRTTYEPLHAKMLLTDEHLLVSSVNLNQMNLGFLKTAKRWRANTECIATCSDPAILEKAKSDYLQVFTSALEVESKLAEKIEKTITTVFTNLGLQSRSDVKKLFSLFVIRKEVAVTKSVLRLGRLARHLCRKLHTRTVSREEFLMSFILYQLSEQKQTLTQLEGSLNIFDGCADTLPTLIMTLLTHRFIEEIDGFYRINLEALDP